MEINHKHSGVLKWEREALSSLILLAATPVSKLHLKRFHAAQSTSIQLLINSNYELLWNKGAQQGDLQFALIAVISKHTRCPSMVFCWACSCLGRCVTLHGQPAAQDLHATPKLNTSTMKQLLLIGTSLAHRGPFGYVSSLKINITETGNINKGGQNHLQDHYYHSLQTAKKHD